MVLQLDSVFVCPTEFGKAESNHLTGFDSMEFGLTKVRHIARVKKVLTLK